MSARVALELAGRALSVSNLEKVLFPRTGFTKGALLDYYRAVAPALLPHIAERPLTLVRFPEGVEKPGWFQTNVRGEPEWIPVAEVAGKAGQRLRYVLVNEEAALVWVANLGTIELHPFLARASSPDEPRVLVFDLDPGAPASLLECAAVASMLRERLAALGLEAFVKTSGGNGLHMYVPLGGGHRFEATKAFARSLARELEAAEPARVISRMKKAERAGKVFTDWGQNDRSKSTVAPYSLRATPAPLVSTPLEWDELAAALRAHDSTRLVFGPEDALARLDRLGDLFRPVLERSQTLS